MYNKIFDQVFVHIYTIQVSNSDEMVNASECVFWNFTLNDGYGDWSTEGCRKALVNNSRIVCQCDHLTSFAVIVVRKTRY